MHVCTRVQTRAHSSLAPNLQDVDASFLKKNEREEQEQAVKQEEAMKQYLQSKRAAAEEEVVLSYCFRSETTHRKFFQVTCRAWLQSARRFLTVPPRFWCVFL